MQHPTIELSSGEMLVGAVIGIRRHIENLMRGRRHAHNYDGRAGWQIHIEGALGEQALAKYLGVFHSGAFVFRGEDVANLQVRTTGHEDGCLIVHHTDPSRDPFVLVTGAEGRYTIRGWLYGGAAMQEKWQRDPTGKGRPAFFVPQSELMPVATLPVVRKTDTNRRDQ